MVATCTDPRVWFAYTIGVLPMPDRTGVMLSVVSCGVGFSDQNLKLLWMKVPYRST